jgi:hypothetical protein
MMEIAQISQKWQQARFSGLGAELNSRQRE